MKYYKDDERDKKARERALKLINKGELRPCPSPSCCSDGYNLYVFESFDFVHCRSCGLNGPQSDGHVQDAVERWNALPRENELLSVRPDLLVEERIDIRIGKEGLKLSLSKANTVSGDCTIPYEWIIETIKLHKCSW